MSDHQEPIPEPDDVLVDLEQFESIGSDPWMRFDLWAGRVWSSVEDAVNYAKANNEVGGPMPTAVQASFCAAQFAQEMAQAVNPLSVAPSSSCHGGGIPSSIPIQAILDLIVDDGDD